MDKERRDGIVILAAVSSLSACFVFSANIYQDQFAQEVCEMALFDYQKDYGDRRTKCEVAADDIDRANLSRWFVGVIFSSAIVIGVIKTLE